MPYEMRYARKTPQRRAVMYFGKRARMLATVLGIASAALSGVQAFAGVAQPPMMLAGTIYDGAGRLVTQGELAISYTPEGGGTPFVVTVPLAETMGPAGILSYAAMVPLEIATATSPISKGALAVPAAPVQYTRAMQVLGSAITRTDSVAISADSVGTIERVNLPAVDPGSQYHSGDVNRDYRFSLGELLREIELFTGSPVPAAYRCDPMGEDGFGLGAGDTDCTPHSGDYSQDWAFSSEELLRMIELYSATGNHEYSRDSGPGSPDGFRAGPPSKSAEPSLKVGKKAAFLPNMSALAMQREFSREEGASETTFDVTVYIPATGQTSVTAMGLEEFLPVGWEFDTPVGGSVPAVMPNEGTSGLLVFAWLPAPVNGGSFTYRIKLSEGMSSGSPCNIDGESLYRMREERDVTRIPVLQMSHVQGKTRNNETKGQIAGTQDGVSAVAGGVPIPVPQVLGSSAPLIAASEGEGEYQQDESVSPEPLPVSAVVRDRLENVAVSESAGIMPEGIASPVIPVIPGEGEDPAGNADSDVDDEDVPAEEPNRHDHPASNQEQVPLAGWPMIGALLLSGVSRIWSKRNGRRDN